MTAPRAYCVLPLLNQPPSSTRPLTREPEVGSASKLRPGHEVRAAHPCTAQDWSPLKTSSIPHATQPQGGLSFLSEKEPQAGLRLEWGLHATQGVHANPCSPMHLEAPHPTSCCARQDRARVCACMRVCFVCVCRQATHAHMSHGTIRVYLPLGCPPLWSAGATSRAWRTHTCGAP